MGLLHMLHQHREIGHTPVEHRAQPFKPAGEQGHATGWIL